MLYATCHVFAACPAHTTLTASLVCRGPSQLLPLCREGLTQNKPALWHNLRERLAREVPATMHGEWTAHFDPMIDVDAASMRMDVTRWGEFRLSSAAPRTIRLGLGLGLGRAY